MNMPDDEYFSRPAEQLVLEGYRYWSNGYALGSIQPWEAARALFINKLGNLNGRRALSSLSNFISVLGTCATCPLKTYPYGARHLCRDEVLILGLIAGIQYDDKQMTNLCLRHLSCPTQCDHVAVAAGEFALVLKTMNKVLMPIPLEVIQQVIKGEPFNHQQITLH